MSPEQKRVNIDTLKQGISLLAFAQQLTTLRPISRRGEYAGPCPCCGGKDRFHVKGERFYCRQCTPRGGDVLDLVQRVYQVSFREACALLADTPAFSSDRPVAVSEVSARQEVPGWQSEAYQRSARKTMSATQRLLFQPEGSAGQAYLASRGLTEATWRTYKLGVGRTLHPVRREQREAIFIPWFTEDKRIAAIQHRFMDPDLGNHERYSMKPGSQPLLFGLHALAPAERLFVVEGEFNAMALHQVGEQAISVGSEANRGNRRVLDLLREKLPSYAQVLVWFDTPAAAAQLMHRLGEGPFRKESIHSVLSPVDANALLVAGELAALLDTV